VVPFLPVLPVRRGPSRSSVTIRCSHKLSTWCRGALSRSLQGLRHIRSCEPPATLQMTVVALGTLQTGLLEWCIGRPSGLPDAPTPVSPQCSCATNFPSEIQRPYYRCAYQPSLVAGSRADPLQARCHGVHSANVSGRRALRSAGTNRILVPPVTSTTVDSRVFSIAAPLI